MAKSMLDILADVHQLVNTVSDKRNLQCMLLVFAISSVSTDAVEGFAAFLSITVWTLVAMMCLKIPLV